LATRKLLFYLSTAVKRRHTQPCLGSSRLLLHSYKIEVKVMCYRMM